MCINMLRTMYQFLVKGEIRSNVKFFYKIPCTSLEVGVAPIEDDTDIELLCNSYNGLKFMHIYVEEGEQPLVVMSPDGRILQKRVTTSRFPALTWHSEWHEKDNNGKFGNSANSGVSYGSNNLGGGNPSVGNNSSQPSTSQSPNKKEKRFKQTARKSVSPLKKFYYHWAAAGIDDQSRGKEKSGNQKSTTTANEDEERADLGAPEKPSTSNQYAEQADPTAPERPSTAKHDTEQVNIECTERVRTGTAQEKAIDSDFAAWLEFELAQVVDKLKAVPGSETSKEKQTTTSKQTNRRIGGKKDSAVKKGSKRAGGRKSKKNQSHGLIDEEELVDDQPIRSEKQVSPDENQINQSNIETGGSSNLGANRGLHNQRQQQHSHEVGDDNQQAGFHNKSHQQNVDSGGVQENAQHWTSDLNEGNLDFDFTFESFDINQDWPSLQTNTAAAKGQDDGAGGLKRSEGFEPSQPPQAGISSPDLSQPVTPNPPSSTTVKKSASTSKARKPRGDGRKEKQKKGKEKIIGPEEFDDDWLNQGLEDIQFDPFSTFRGTEDTNGQNNTQAECPSGVKSTGTGQTEFVDPHAREEWNEPVPRDEDTFNTPFADDEDVETFEHLDFNEDEEFKK